MQKTDLFHKPELHTLFDCRNLREVSFVITSKKPDADVRLELLEWENI